ncbi:MAG: hypothetical protein P1P86_02625 [Bacteroidales bacterium]|nr:hypothetical protein [Bacteroidales bacterium]
MNRYTKVKFWSLPVVGIVCILIGGFLYPYGPEKRVYADFFLLAGLGQIVIFAVLLFFWVRRKNREAKKA